MSNAACDITGIFQQVLHAELIRETKDQGENNSRKQWSCFFWHEDSQVMWQTGSCDLCLTDERVLTGLTHILRTPWKPIPCKNHHRWHFPPFLVINRWEYIWNGNICCFLSERRRICFLEPFCPAEAIPRRPSGVHGERAANSHAWRHTHTPADECSVEGLPLWPRGRDQHTHTHLHSCWGDIPMCLSKCDLILRGRF